MIISGTRIGGSRFIDGSTSVVSDDYFNLVALLLPGNGTNGAQNNTFLDSSTNNFTVTRNGNPTQGTFSPFSQTGWSGYFDGSGDNLSVADNAAFEFGSGSFTVEMWFYLGASGTNALVTKNRSGTGADGGLTIDVSTTTIRVYIDGNAGTTLVSNVSTTISLNTWYHLAVVRSVSGGTNNYVFLNGVAVGTSTTSTAFADNSQPVKIGTDNLSGSNYNQFTGYISNLRIVKGTAVYTSAFTPPTAPLTAISGTSLLTCQSNRFIDNSTNAFAISAAGNTAVQAFSPFDPTAAYSTSTVGGSGYFDGTGDELNAGTQTQFSFGTGAYTVELWVYLTAAVSASHSPGFVVNNTTGGFGFYNDAGTNLTIFQRGVNIVLASSTTLAANTWNHVVAVRSSTSANQTSIFVNGVRVANGTDAINWTITGPLLVGGLSLTNYYLNGYISSVRVVKGTAVYDPTQSTLTVPTAPLTAIANTSLLLNYTNAGITDAAAKNVLETAGGASISTTQSKWGGSAMAFDGSGDYLTFPITPLITSLGPTYTIEAWIYLANTTGVKTIYSTSVASTANYGYFIFYVNGSSLGFYNRAATGGAETGIVAGTLSANTWTHVAISVNSNSGRLYINGTQVGSTTTINTTTYTPVYNAIGADIIQGYNFNGYINDLRITRGLARYTANFTAPTAAFPTQ